MSNSLKVQFHSDLRVLKKIIPSIYEERSTEREQTHKRPVTANIIHERKIRIPKEGKQRASVRPKSKIDEVIEKSFHNISNLLYSRYEEEPSQVRVDEYRRTNYERTSSPKQPILHSGRLRVPQRKVVSARSSLNSTEGFTSERNKLMTSRPYFELQGNQMMNPNIRKDILSQYKSISDNYANFYQEKHTREIETSRPKTSSVIRKRPQIDGTQDISQWNEPEAKYPSSARSNSLKTPYDVLDTIPERKSSVMGPNQKQLVYTVTNLASAANRRFFHKARRSVKFAEPKKDNILGMDVRVVNFPTPKFKSELTTLMNTHEDHGLNPMYNKN